LKQINKTELFESAKCVLDDIETILFYNSAGLYYLPEDCGGELTYKFFGQDLIVEFEWEEVNALDTNIVLGDYYNNEATIKIILIIMVQCVNYDLFDFCAGLIFSLLSPSFLSSLFQFSLS
jgi:hypothetical protein